MLNRKAKRRPMCENNTNILNIIKKSINTFKNAEKLSFKKLSNSIKKDIPPPCFTGWIRTLNAVLDLYEFEKSEILLTIPSTKIFLMTNRLCQDPIENLFSIFRQKGGYSKNSTCRTLRSSFASVMLCMLIKIITLCLEKSNCEEEDDIFWILVKHW